MVRWTGVIGAIAGLVGCVALAPLQTPTTVAWAVFLAACFLAAGWLSWQGHSRGLAALGVALTTLAFLGMWTIGRFFLPGAVLVATAAALPGEESRLDVRWAVAVLAGAMVMVGVRWLSLSAWQLTLPAALLGAAVAAWALGGRHGPTLAAAMWAGFGWVHLGYTVWYLFH